MSVASSLALTGGNLPAPPPGPPPSHQLLSFEQLQETAKAVAKSGLFPGVATEAAALTLMMLCQAEGLPAVKALQRYHIIEGRPSMRAEAMLAEFQRQGGRYRFLRYDAEECAMEFWHPALHPEPITITKTLQQFKDSGLAMAFVKNGDGAMELKKNWRQHTDQMLIARCVTQGVNMIAPGVKCGIYTPEETLDILDEERAGGGNWSAPALPPRAPATPPASADLTVVGQAKEGRDDRPFWKVVEDAAAEAGRQWESYQGSAGLDAAERRPLPGRKDIERALLRRAIDAGHVESPGTIKAARVTEILAGLYAEHRAWLREATGAHLDEAAREAQAEMQARLDARSASDGAEGGQEVPGDDDLPPGRMPGED